MHAATPRSLRSAYVEWVEEQIEEFKDRIPRSQLLAIADEVIGRMRVNAEGQYQLTEMLLCDAVDRRIFRMLKLPGYRAWCMLREGAEQTVISFPLPDRLAVAPAPAAAAAPAGPRLLEDEPERLACVG